MFYTFVDRLTLLSPLVLLIGLAVGVYKYRLLNATYRMFFYYLLLCIVFDILTRIPSLVLKTNLILLVLFSLCELIFFYVFYLRIYSNRKSPILLLCTPIGIAYIVYELFSLNFQDPEQFQSYAKVVDTLLVVLMALGYFLEGLQKSPEEIWNFFKMNGAVLICFSFYIVFFVPINYLIQNNMNIQLSLWVVHLLITAAFYLFITIELWKSGKTKRQLPSGC